MMRRTMLMVLLIVCLWTSKVHAQGLPVIDISNLLQNTVQAVQSVLMVIHMVEELLPLGDIILNDTFASDLDDLSAIVREAQGLSYDLASLNSQISTLFDLNTVPRTSRDLQLRIVAMRKAVVDSYVYAMRTQTLMRTVLSTVRHLTRLIAAIDSLVGNMQANQTMIELEQKLNQTLATMQTQTAAFERAESVERLMDPIIGASMDQIRDTIMADWPR